MSVCSNVIADIFLATSALMPEFLLDPTFRPDHRRNDSWRTAARVRLSIFSSLATARATSTVRKWAPGWKILIELSTSVATWLPRWTIRRHLSVLNTQAAKFQDNNRRMARRSRKLVEFCCSLAVQKPWATHRPVVPAHKVLRDLPPYPISGASACIPKSSVTNWSTWPSALVKKHKSFRSHNDWRNNLTWTSCEFSGLATFHWLEMKGLHTPFSTLLYTPCLTVWHTYYVCLWQLWGLNVWQCFCRGLGSLLSLSGREQRHLPFFSPIGSSIVILLTPRTLRSLLVLRLQYVKEH